MRDAVPYHAGCGIIRQDELVMVTAKPPRIVRFGVYEIDLNNTKMRKHGLRIRIQDQPFQVLSALLERRGGVVTRDELVRHLWPEGTFVDFDRGLNAAVNRLRQTLSDSAENPRYIETVARQGYRFLMPIEMLTAGGQAVDKTGPALAPFPRGIVFLSVLVGAIVAGAVVLIFLGMR
jgi:cholera toxin transcriptional activator